MSDKISTYRYVYCSFDLDSSSTNYNAMHAQMQKKIWERINSTDEKGHFSFNSTPHQKMHISAAEAFIMMMCWSCAVKNEPALFLQVGRQCAQQQLF